VYGPFSTVSVLPRSRTAQVRALPGVRRADPVLVLHATVRTPRITDVNLVGYLSGGLGQPHPTLGRLPDARGEVVADRSLPGVHLGSTFVISGNRCTVTGLVTGRTVNGAGR
jgi:hypothetical protein